MPERPLLMLPTPGIAPRDKLPPTPISSHYHIPSIAKQRDKLTPRFETMLQSFITDSTEGVEPEYVLVLETTGKIEDFSRAVRAIPGLEWLAESDTDTLSADDEFYEIAKIGKRLLYQKIDDISTKQSSAIWELLKDNDFIDKAGYVTGKNIDDFIDNIPDDLTQYQDQILDVLKEKISATGAKQLSGRLFLTMSNRQAMEQLLAEFNKWSQNEEVSSKKWAEIFKCLKVMRKWGIQDRLRDTGVIEYWRSQLDLKKGTDSKIQFEIELWYRRNEAKRSEIQSQIEELILKERGNVIAGCHINEIRFHAIKAELPPDKIELVVNSEYATLFKSDDVMFFRPAGQCVANVIPEGNESDDIPVADAIGEPVIALFDGVPFLGHTLLADRIIYDDPDDFGADYLAAGRKHGTAMASLICYGELDANEPPLSRPIYVRPIMKPDSEDFVNTPPSEHIPRDQFFEDLILRSVVRIFEGDGDDDPIAPNIKVINISICDPTRLFFGQLSSCGKLLDWLSEKYQVLFCVSAGNTSCEIELQKNQAELGDLDEAELAEHTIKKIHDDIRNHRILAPGDSINSLTIGALHNDCSPELGEDPRVDILPIGGLPSPVSAHGHGYRNSINPELYAPGGKQLFDYIGDGKYKVNMIGTAPGQRVAASPISPGELNRTVYIRGTSNSAALVTRGAAILYEAISSLRDETGASIPENSLAVLIKTLLVHSASWGEYYSILERCIKTADNSRIFRKIAARYFGYGEYEVGRVIECTEKRATAFGYGTISKDQKHVFRFPLPPSLSGSNEDRRLIITLGWFSPINAENRKYRKANLSFNPPKDFGVKRVNADWQHVKNGSIQHEVLEGNDVVSYSDGDAIMLEIVCREDAGSLDESVSYGLAVSLEVPENVDIQVYEEIRQRIEIQVPVE